VVKGEVVRAGDPVEELGFALAEGRAELLTDKVRARIVGRALAVRSPGRPSQSPEEIPGLEAFRRAINQMDALLADLGERDWRRPALRDLSVQELIGHLVAAEEAFLNGLEGFGETPDSSEHVSSTQVIAKAQSGRPPAASRADWRERTARTVAACAERSPELVANYYGIVLPLDLLLVVRSFEIWVHHEDIRRSTGRPLQAPDDEVLARMVQLAAALLPIGLVGAVGPGQEASVRLVLTGTGGGAWDIPLGRFGLAGAGFPAPGAVVIVDTPTFCRVVGNREDLQGSGSIVLGDVDLAEKLFVGAASLALD
jgi:uncharacterized protein (TIGR03083 family)